GVFVALVALRFVKPGLLVWIAAWWAAVFVLVHFGFATPVPASAQKIYLSITSLALFLYTFTAEERSVQVTRPIVALLTEPRYTPLRALVAIAIPALVAFDVYRTRTAPLEAPFFARTIHPSPPTTITVHDVAVDLVKTENPFRKLKESDPDGYKKALASGR